MKSFFFKSLVFSLLIVLLFSCNKEDSDGEVCVSTSEFNHLQFFGFSLIDVYWDDPLDEEVKTVYSDEVNEFSNLADILVVSPEDFLVERMQEMNDLGMNAYFHLNELFFELTDETAPSGTHYELRSDYEDRWSLFVSTNSLVDNENMIGAFYIGEEPTWNGISFEELSLASDLIDASFPDVPILLVEAYPSLDSLQIPVSVDWIGFDHYFILDPLHDSLYRAELDLLKSKFTSDNQNLIIIMDTHYIPWAHGDFGGISQSQMKDVAINYYELAKSEDKAIGILGYTWPGGFDSEDMLGARQLSEEVKLEYVRIGKEITGKP